MLILASKSPARQALLRNAGLAFEVHPANVDERALESATTDAPTRLAEKLALAKARAVSSQFPEAIIVGADQILAFNGEVLHKPADLDDARNRLTALCGNTHQLHSGVALVKNGTPLWSTVETASLTMRTTTEKEREAVLREEGPDIIQSVGAYRLEGPSIRLFSKIEGDYFTILGLPLLPLLDALRTHAPQTLDQK